MNQRIFELMEQKGIKMQHLAIVLGIKPSRIYDWKRNKSAPTEHEWGLIAQALDVSLAYLTGEEGSKQATAQLTTPTSALYSAPVEAIALTSTKLQASLSQLTQAELEMVEAYVDFLLSRRDAK